MCEPTTLAIASFAVSTAGTIASTMQQQQDAENANAVARQTAENANEATRQAYTQEALRDIQEENVAAQQIDMHTRAARQQQATARVGSGESGTAGLATDTLMRNLYGQELGNIDTIRTNLAMTRQQSKFAKKGTQATGKDRVNAASASMQNPPSMLGAALQIGASGAQGFADYKHNTGAKGW